MLVEHQLGSLHLTAAISTLPRGFVGLDPAVTGLSKRDMRSAFSTLRMYGTYAIGDLLAHVVSLVFRLGKAHGRCQVQPGLCHLARGRRRKAEDPPTHL